MSGGSTSSRYSAAQQDLLKERTEKTMTDSCSYTQADTQAVS